jgi:hypothetical protein
LINLPGLKTPNLETEEGTVHVLTDSGFRNFQEAACGFTPAVKSSNFATLRQGRALSAQFIYCIYELREM